MRLLWYNRVLSFSFNPAILIQNRKFKHLLSLMGKNRDKLTATFTDQQKELLEKYDDVINEMHSLAEVESFTCGFSLGVRLMMESVSIQLTTED